MPNDNYERQRHYDMEFQLKQPKESTEAADFITSRLEMEFSNVLSDFLTSIATDPRFDNLTPLEILDLMTGFLQKKQTISEAILTIEAQRIDKM